MTHEFCVFFFWFSILYYFFSSILLATFPEILPKIKFGRSDYLSPLARLNLQTQPFGDIRRITLIKKRRKMKRARTKVKLIILLFFFKFYSRITPWRISLVSWPHWVSSSKHLSRSGCPLHFDWNLDQIF